MPNITLSVSESIKKGMDAFPEVSWSNVCREAILRYIDARKSVNPLARAKFLQMKQKEYGKGYEFGLKFSEKLLEEIEYSEIKSIFNQISYWEMVDWDDGAVTTWIYNNISATNYVQKMNEFEEKAKKRGKLEWLLKRAEKEEEFNRNLEFVDGMIKALKEIYQ